MGKYSICKFDFDISLRKNHMIHYKHPKLPNQYTWEVLKIYKNGNDSFLEMFQMFQMFQIALPYLPDCKADEVGRAVG